MIVGAAEAMAKMSVLEHRIREPNKIMEFFPQALQFTSHKAESYRGVMRRAEQLRSTVGDSNKNEANS